jgi:DME family drug/metabolite transporter
MTMAAYRSDAPDSGGLGTRAAGYAAALAAGTLWGTTGPLSAALYAVGAEITGVGFWRIAIATLGLLIFGLARPALLRIDRRGLLLVGLGGGAMVAVFEVAYQYAIAGVGVAGAAALLYTAPVLVAILARLFLAERLTVVRLVLAVGVMVGAALTVAGGSGFDELFESREAGLAAGLTGGLMAAGAYAGTTLIARYAVPRYGAVRVLFLELSGGTFLLAVLLPLTGNTPAPPSTAGGWVFILLLALGAVLGANFLFFAALKRIEAAPTAVAATIEPVVAAVLALVLFGHGLTAAGWLGLGLVVASVAAGYLRETSPGDEALAPTAERRDT